jgi:YfiH family protein
MNSGWIVPDWDAPANVRALTMTRAGGASTGVYAGLNLGDHVGDEPAAVAQNRAFLRERLPAEPLWLKQVHGIAVACADASTGIPEADAAVAREPGSVCAVLTADCLPVLLCDRQGTVVAAAHAGWRGLVGGVIEATVAEMRREPAELVAWLGPAIGPQAFEVGEEVRQVFLANDPGANSAFKLRLTPHASPLAEQKWLADIYQLARRRLAALGVTRISGGEYCTFSDRERFFSYRRDGATGRMATLIWLENRRA